MADIQVKDLIINAIKNKKVAVLKEIFAIILIFTRTLTI